MPAMATADILSQTSRLSRISKVVSKAGIERDMLSKRSSLNGLVHPKEDDIFSQTKSVQSAQRIFMNPGAVLKDRKADNLQVQEDLLEKIIAKRRIQEKEKHENLVEEILLNEKTRKIHEAE